MLHPYTREGAYGKYFESDATIDFDSDFIVLELEELKAKKDLQTVVLLIVMYRITREMYFSRERKKIVIIDEAWDLLSGWATTLAVVAFIAALAFAASGRPLFAAIVTLVAAVAVIGRRRFMDRMDAQLQARDSGELPPGVCRVRRRHEGFSRTGQRVARSARRRGGRDVVGRDHRPHLRS